MANTKPGDRKDRNQGGLSAVTGQCDPGHYGANITRL